MFILPRKWQNNLASKQVVCERLYGGVQNPLEKTGRYRKAKRVGNYLWKINMNISFEKFIERKFRGLNFISIPTSAHVPGVILNNNDRVESALYNLFPEEPSSRWKTSTINADMRDINVKGHRALEIDSKLLGIVGISGSASASYEIDFQFEEVSSLVFDTDNGAVFENEIRTMLTGLRSSNRPAWRQILHEFVVTEAVYVKTAVLRIHRNGNAIEQADFPTHAGELNIDGAFEWRTDGTMVVENSRNIPFGLLGFIVKRNM